MALLPLVLLLGAFGCERPVPGQEPADASAVYAERPKASPDGIGKLYMGREISRTMGHRGADWLERPERARTEMPDRVVEALELQPSDVVADIGAGTGYFTFRLAQKVPRGMVYAVDIQPEMLEIIRERIAARGLGNVEPIRGTVTDPGLPAESVDVALIVDAYHEFSHPREMAEAIKEDLRPGGRLVLVEYRGEDPTLPIKPLHKMTEAQAVKEMEAAGFEWRSTEDILPQQHFLVFEKPMEE